MPDEQPNTFDIVRVLVRAHEQPSSINGGRASFLYLKHAGGAFVQHHGFGDEGPPAIDEALLDELHGEGLIDLDYSGNALKFTPTARARELVAQYDRATSTQPDADLGPLLVAISAQHEASNKLGWPAVRPVLEALRAYWEASGFPPTGIRLMPLKLATPAEHDPLLVATVSSLVRAGYLDQTSYLGFDGIPLEVRLTDRAHEVLDGWPGATPDDLAQNLVAVLTAQVAAETDSVKRGRLESVLETVRQLGVETTSAVLAKVITGT